MIELQQQGADHFWGKSFEVDDLMRISSDGRGMISVLRVNDIQDKPKLFSTFMLQMLAELYATCPEEGDMDKPKLVMFIDEAHLIFQEASDELVKQIETIVKLIRSKGIGVFFCTQNPMDIPASVLGATRPQDPARLARLYRGRPKSDQADSGKIIQKRNIIKPRI